MIEIFHDHLKKTLKWFVSLLDDLCDIQTRREGPSQFSTCIVASHIHLQDILKLIVASLLKSGPGNTFSPYFL